MTRKFLALLLAMAMLFSFAACGILPEFPWIVTPTEPTDPQPTEPQPTEPQPTEPQPTEPQPTEPQPTVPDAYLNLSGSHLDAIGKVTTDVFNDKMNADWNFGWHGDGSLEGNALKVNFGYDAADSDVIWRLGTYGAEGTGMHINAGWGAGLWAKGAGNISYMYNKVDIHEHATQFRVWAVSNTDNHWSGSGAIRAVALYKDAEGNWVEHVFTPVADTFTTGEASFNEANGTVEFANGIWSMPGTLDGCMIIYDMADLAGKEDVIIMVQSVGLGTVLGDEFTEAAEGVPAGEVMPDVVIVKRIMFIVETPIEPTDPQPTEPQPTIPADQEVYLGMTGTQLDALPSIGADTFGDAMNEQWNFGWGAVVTPDAIAGKVDFDGTAADTTKWHVGTVGTASHGNAGWGVQLAPSGVGSNAYMYNKLDIPAEGISQFRIWAALLKNEGWSGNAAIRVVAAYKNADGNYVREILTPVGEAASFYNAEDGTTRITVGSGDWTVNGIADGMMIYGIGSLAGKEDVTIFIETLGLEDGTTDHVIFKRIMFLG